MITNLIKHNNKDLGISAFRKDIDRLFNDFFFHTPGTLFKNEWEPSIDIEDGKDAIHVKAEIPGIDEKDLDVKIENNTLIVSGEKKEEKKEEKKNYVYTERKFGSFYRSIDLPDGIKADKIKATFKKGVLSIDIPKGETTKPQKIAITVN